MAIYNNDEDPNVVMWNRQNESEYIRFLVEDGIPDLAYKHCERLAANIGIPINGDYIKWLILAAKEIDTKYDAYLPMLAMSFPTLVKKTTMKRRQTAIEIATNWGNLPNMSEEVRCNIAAMDNKYFWKDKSGRGFTNTFDLDEVRRTFKRDVNYNGETIFEWLETAEVGDEWENRTDQITRIK